jgi:predicted aspartyl protease
MRKLLFMILILAKPGLAQEIKIPFREWKGLPLIEVTIGNTKTIALLDTGATGNLVDPSFYKFPKANTCETDSISSFGERGMVCKVRVEIVVSEKLRYRATILEGRSEALPKEVRAILSAHDLVKNGVLQINIKNHIITISDSRDDDDEFAKARAAQAEEASRARP